MSLSPRLLSLVAVSRLHRGNVAGGRQRRYVFVCCSVRDDARAAKAYHRRVAARAPRREPGEKEANKRSTEQSK